MLRAISPTDHKLESFSTFENFLSSLPCDISDSAIRASYSVMVAETILWVYCKVLKCETHVKSMDLLLSACL